MDDHDTNEITDDDVLRMVRRTKPRAKPWTEVAITDFARMLRANQTAVAAAAEPLATDSDGQGGLTRETPATRVVALIGPDGRDSGWTLIGDRPVPPAGPSGTAGAWTLRPRDTARP